MENKSTDWFSNAFKGTLGVVVGLNILWLIPLILVLVMCCGCMMVFTLSAPTTVQSETEIVK